MCESITGLSDLEMSRLRELDMLIEQAIKGGRSLTNEERQEHASLLCRLLENVKQAADELGKE